MDQLKVLGQSAPAATTPTDLYTVPSLAQTTCSALVVCNRGTSGTFRVSIRVGGAVASNEQYIFYDKSVDANETFKTILGMTLQETDVVTVYASSANFSFNLFGVETT